MANLHNPRDPLPAPATRAGALTGGRFYQNADC